MNSPDKEFEKCNIHLNTNIPEVTGNDMYKDV